MSKKKFIIDRILRRNYEVYNVWMSVKLLCIRESTIFFRLLKMNSKFVIDCDIFIADNMIIYLL